ncbi:hypothetical protein NOM01_08120 [Sporolactobacillus sp. STSJ-5]|uniref:hypothetical protein n=1 Tax=Sporolactobacillus sp. STSJ-5 TaxID=2965076 RepID=UPI0021060CEC|nr:hypothetical protein [Sporolactobacillus sp. STSJ-5]MCQ2009973.1 hypothetical protein [Sporolactobacillus sp. STSJ-5]
MDKKERATILGIGVIGGMITGLVFKAVYPCLVSGILVSAIITVMLTQKQKRNQK